jgi:ankyrin repeat protein
MHIIELYLAINVLKNGKPALTEKSHEGSGFPWKPWSEKGFRRTPLTPFLHWYKTLGERGLSWEANKILRLLLPSLNIDEVAGIIRPEQLSLAVKSVDGLKASEPILLTVLTVANDILRYALASFRRDGIVGTRGLLEFVAPYYEVATTVVKMMFGPEPDDSQGRLVVQWKLATEQMTYLRNADMVDNFELHPLFIRLEMAAISLEDIRLQAELIPAVCWTDPENDDTSGTPPLDASPIIDANWDLTLLAAPLHALVKPSSDASLKRLKKILRHRPPGWQTAQPEVWNLLLVKANDDQRYELLLNLTKILAEDGSLTLDDSPALQLAFLLLAQSPDLVLHQKPRNSPIFHKAAQLGVIPIIEVALKAEKSRVEEFLSTRDFSGYTPVDYAIENKQEAVIAKLLSSGCKMPIATENLYELARYADPKIVEMMGMLLPNYIDLNAIREAIERDRSDVARVLLQIYNLQSPNTGELEKLLRLAVQRRQTDVVEILVSKFPESALKLDETGRSVLWYNKPPSDREDSQIKQMIRDKIAPIIIKKVPIAEAKRILGEGGKYFLNSICVFFSL